MPQAHTAAVEGRSRTVGVRTARAAGRPVGSSAVEAACKSVIAVRVKRPGARRKQASADRTIQLCALALSDRRGEAIELNPKHQRREARMSA